ncbi:hypothetical protein AAFF_G00301450 [Aldrovandia affinis]|uniref:Uncharacterized protein n=1 Tax=Aldrovandia affinis TaxID=143900 RepID=A0AAD7WRB9_9TELE|nr:hypothetical protein AAFF_G00301450 [Aldrovandia affinis]
MQMKRQATFTLSCPSNHSLSKSVSEMLPPARPLLSRAGLPGSETHTCGPLPPFPSLKGIRAATSTTPAQLCFRMLHLCPPSNPPRLTSPSHSVALPGTASLVMSSLTVAVVLPDCVTLDAGVDLA